MEHVQRQTADLVEQDEPWTRGQELSTIYWFVCKNKRKVEEKKRRMSKPAWEEGRRKELLTEWRE